jgi:ABC-type transporter Mla subunit MlaD
MALTDSAEEARKNFEKLQKLATSLRKDLSGLNLGDTVRDAETVKELLNGWGKEFQDSLASIDSIGASFQQTVSEISKGNVGLNQTKKSFNKLTSLASDLTNHTRGYNKLSVKQLESITSQAQQEKKRLETTLDTLKAEKASLIESRKQGNQTKESLDKIKQINSAISEAEGLLNNEKYSI